MSLLLALSLWASPPFDLEATRRALQRAEGREAAFAALDQLAPPERAAARAGGVGGLLLAIALDPSAALAQRGGALRLIPYYAPEAAAALAPLLADSAAPEAVALGREAARALAACGPGAHPTLAAAVAHPDPEIRARIAGSGALGAEVCALLEDPWPVVVRAAARGLGAALDAPCLAAAVAHADPVVAQAASAAAGRSPQPELTAALRRRAGDAKAPLGLRIEALIALGRRGDREQALRILHTHHAKGGLEALADGAVRALAAEGSPESLAPLRRALKSKAPKIRASAAAALAQRGDVGSLPAIRALRDRATGPERRLLEEAAGRLAPAGASLGDLEAGADAPEDPLD